MRDTAHAELVPGSVTVDGARFPLASSPLGVRTADDPQYPGLAGLSYVVGAMITRPTPARRTAELRRREDVRLPQELYATLLEDDDYGDGVDNWINLGGAPPDIADAYYVAASWIRPELVIPRRTFINLLVRVGDLHDAVRAGRLAPRPGDRY